MTDLGIVCVCVCQGSHGLEKRSGILRKVPDPVKVWKRSGIIVFSGKVWKRSGILVFVKVWRNYQSQSLIVDILKT